MRKSLLVLSSAVCSMAFLLGCGGNGGEITADQAIEITKEYDKTYLTGEHLVSSCSLNGKINAFSMEGEGLIGYKDLSKGDTLYGYDLTGTKIKIANQDIAKMGIPNALLYKYSSEESKELNKDDEGMNFSSILYLLSATISEDMINWYTGNLEIYGINKWEHLKTTFTATTDSSNNKILGATIEIDNFEKFADEFSKTGLDTEEILPFLGDGSLKATIGCDAYGYISSLSFAIKGDNVKIQEGTVPEKNSVNVSSSMISSFDNIDPQGISLNGKMDINISLNIDHELATGYPVKFKRSAYKDEEDYRKQEKLEEITIEDITKDDVFSFVSYEPIKHDPIRGGEHGTDIYAKKDEAYGELDYKIKLKLNDKIGEEANPYSYISEFDADKTYEYGSVSVNGIRIPFKEKSESTWLDTSYCYFKFETDDSENKYLCVFISSDIINSYVKSFSDTPSFLINIDLYKKVEA